MSDDGLEPIDVTGRWVGFSQCWEKPGRYPIVADLRQTGDRITGEIYDQLRDRADYFGNSVLIFGMQIPNDIRRNFEQVIRRFGTETVPNFHLPDRSEVEGKVTGSQVRFTKTYRGLKTTWTVGEKEGGSFRREGHQVQYSGEFDRDRMCIVGSWGITQGRLLNRLLTPQARGGFELNRRS
jgi:hypothetical protein